MAVATRPADPGPTGTRRVGTRWAALLALAVLVVGTVVAVDRWRARQPFGPAAISVDLVASVVVQRTDRGKDVQARLDPLGRQAGQTSPTRALPVGVGARHVVGTLTVHAPHAPPGSKWLMIVLDPRRNATMSLWSTTVGTYHVFDESMARALADRYSWLAPVADPPTYTGRYYSNTYAMSFDAGRQQPVVFAVTGGGPGPRLADTPATARDAIYVLALISPDWKLWWARPIQPTTQ